MRGSFKTRRQKSRGANNWKLMDRWWEFMKSKKVNKDETNILSVKCKYCVFINIATTYAN